MNLRYGKNKRKAISPVLATVILIAITLIAAIAIAGFVFGLFGSFTSTAQVSASVTACTASTDSCAVTLRNTGTANAVVTGCSLLNAGASVTSTPTGTTTVNAGSSANVVCTATTVVAQTLGSQAGGSFSMSNGGTVQFAGTWQ